MSNKGKGLAGFYEKLPPSLIKKNNVTLIPEGAIGYLVGPTLALLANSILANYFNKYMSDVLHINTWAKGFFTWLPVISVIFVVIGNILVGRLMDNNVSKAGKARPLLLLSVPISLLALLFLDCALWPKTIVALALYKSIGLCAALKLDAKDAKCPVKGVPPPPVVALPPFS